MQIRVASLNFSGINISPFEYYDGTHQKTQLNNLFRSLLEIHYKEFLQYSSEMAKIDKNFQKNRYTILYRSDVGVARGRLLNKQQFEAVWDLTYDDNHPTDENNSKFQKISHLNAIDKLKIFDRIVYQAFLQTIFGKIEWSKIRDYDPQLYLEQLKKWHSKTYLQLDLKVRSLNDYIRSRNLDLLFVQQAQINAISNSLPDNYFSVHSEKSMIIARKSSFKQEKQDQEFFHRFNQPLNFNQDSCYLKLQGYLLISAHLSSKKIKTQQAENMKQILNQIMEYDPSLKIVVGIDANQFLQMAHLNAYPLTDHNITTRKRRTDMQLQFEKSGIIVQDVKDHILTNLKHHQSIIETVRCQHITNQLLPNQKHPFDHFVVYSSIIDQSLPIIHIHSVDLFDLPSPISLKKTDTISTSNTNYERDFKIERQIPQLFFKSRQKNDNLFEDRSNRIQSDKKYKRLLYPQTGLIQFNNKMHSKSSRKRSCKIQSPSSDSIKFDTDRIQIKAQLFKNKNDHKASTPIKTNKNIIHA